MDLPDRLQALEPELKRYGSRLRFNDWKALKEGKCRAVAAKLRRRSAVAVWVMGTAVVLLAVANLWRALEDARDGRRWPWLAAFQSLVFVGLFVQVFVRSRAARALADRLDQLGDAS